MQEQPEINTTSQERTEVEPTKNFQLLYNAAAGEYFVNEWTTEQLDDPENNDYKTQVGYFSEVGLYDSQQELEKAIEGLRGSVVFAVFEDGPAGRVYSSKEDNLTGNWRGSREGHANLVAEFDTQEKADEFVEQRTEYFQNLTKEQER